MQCHLVTLGNKDGNAISIEDLVVPKGKLLKYLVLIINKERGIEERVNIRLEWFT